MEGEYIVGETITFIKSLVNVCGWDDVLQIC